MIITVCGKGGCGKSTTTTFLAREFAARGKKVLVMDCDESNFGLQLQLGMELPKSMVDYDGGKGNVMEYLAGGRENMLRLAKGELSLDNIPEEVYSEKDGIKLMTPGKIQQANESGACAFGVVVREFVSHLTLQPDDVVIMDMEAGTEHFGRGTDNICDSVIMIVDPSYESLCLSGKIAEMSRSIGKKTYFILNKFAEEDLEVMHEEISKEGEIIAELPLKADIRKNGLRGIALKERQPEIEAAVDILLQQNIA